jgi:hypothetical protein
LDSIDLRVRQRIAEDEDASVCPRSLVQAATPERENDWMIQASMTPVRNELR